MRIDLEEVPENLHGIIDIVGEDKFVEIVKVYGGDNIYIPTYKRICRMSRDMEIGRKYNGANASQLGREYNLSANHVRRIAKRD
ncbi:transcriptional regulator [Romboutsia weinsteinii]|uniref:Transcriptional regulator n=1 Tax=Romboutsia weinsteinii TaxID=2020949 RepID=A0A371IY47_9FIRM|nr:Mor transcription activator family protein [Romboutsia weinsteinii]RDY25401.1 transcriptional regulator [Romboutsia weinsteinii]